MRVLRAVMIAFALVCVTPGFALAADTGPDCAVAADLECQPTQPPVPTAKTVCPPTSPSAAEQYFVSDGFGEPSGTVTAEPVTTLAAPPIEAARGEPAPALAIGLALLAIAGVAGVAVRIVRG